MINLDRTTIVITCTLILSLARRIDCRDAFIAVFSKDRFDELSAEENDDRFYSIYQIKNQCEEVSQDPLIPKEYKVVYYEDFNNYHYEKLKDWTVNFQTIKVKNNIDSKNPKEVTIVLKNNCKYTLKSDYDIVHEQEYSAELNKDSITVTKKYSRILI